MACPVCPSCGTQMEEESIYGAKACRCPDCGYKTKPIKVNEDKLEYIKSPKEEEKKK